MSVAPADLTIRVATERDCTQVAQLLTELAHPSTAAEVADRWSAWASAGNSALVAESSSGEIAGLATLHHMHVLHRPRPVGRVTALIVSKRNRGQGVGRSLVAAAESRLKLLGCQLIEVTSHARHAAAHDFYRHVGYEQTGVRLAKTLDQTAR